MDAKQIIIDENLSSKSIPIKAVAWYAVLRGKEPGVYDNVVDARNTTRGFPKGFYRKFDTQEEAEDCFNEYNLVIDFKTPNMYNVLREEWN